MWMRLKIVWTPWRPARALPNRSQVPSRAGRPQLPLGQGRHKSGLAWGVSAIGQLFLGSKLAKAREQAAKTTAIYRAHDVMRLT